MSSRWNGSVLGKAVARNVSSASGVYNTRAVAAYRNQATWSPSSPRNIPDLALWLDATTGLFDATTGGNAVTANDGAVARWEDQSGNGRHATQSTANNRPLLKTSSQNSLNGIAFDGDNDEMSTPSFACTVEFTIFVVVKSNLDSQKDFSRVLEHGANNGLTIIYNGSPRTFRFGYVGGNVNTTITAGTSLFLLEYFNRGSILLTSTTRAQGFQTNGATPIVATATSTPTTPLVFYLSRFGGVNVTYNPAQTLYEVLYWSRELSSEERTWVRNYLNTKWAVY